jgi:hypothetical protein
MKPTALLPPLLIASMLRAIKKSLGCCYVYAYAHNVVYKRVKATVK